jgi:hypothetical protein
MVIWRAYWSAAILAGLVTLTGCSDQGPTDPVASQGESRALAPASKPLRQTFDFPFAFEFDCGSFTGLSSGRIFGHETFFFDKDGNPLPFHFHVQYQATITNTATGKTLADNSSYNGTLDLVTGVLEVNGRIYNVKDRENGIRIKDIGRIVFDAEGNIIFEAGRHDVDGFGDPTALYCAALA